MLETGEGAIASKAPQQHSIASMFKKAAAANSDSSKAGVQESGAQKNNNAGTASEAHANASELQGKPRASQLGAASPVIARVPGDQPTLAASTDASLADSRGAAVQPAQAMEVSAEGVAAAQQKLHPERASCLSPVRSLSQPHNDSVRQQATVSHILERAVPQKPAGNSAPRQAADASCQQHGSAKELYTSQAEERNAHQKYSEVENRDREGHEQVPEGTHRRSEEGEQPAHSAAPKLEQSYQQMSDLGSGRLSAEMSAESAGHAHRQDESRDVDRSNDPSAAPSSAQKDERSGTEKAQRQPSSCREGTGLPMDVNKQQGHRNKDKSEQPQHDSCSKECAQGHPRAAQDPLGQVDEIVPDVDVAEQRRIMRDIWLRQNISKASPKATNRSSAGAVKRKHTPGNEAGAKQLRINSMFKAPAK